MAATQYQGGTDKTNRHNRVMVGELIIRSLHVYSGTAVTRAAVRALVGDGAPIGSLFVGAGAVATTKPHLYVKIANTPDNLDWERVVTQASD